MIAHNNRTLKLTLAYDGTNYRGWQIQPESPTVQGELEGAVATITGEYIRVRGAGRTDAGVHALGQVCSFTAEMRLTTDEVKRALNSLTPGDILIRDIIEVDEGFNPRGDAVGRWYRYVITTRYTPFNRLYRHYFSKTLNIERMREAGKRLPGVHDFTAFTVDAGEQMTTRTMTDFQISCKGDDILIDFLSPGFLRKQVRLMVSALIKAGTGEIEPREMDDIIASKDNTRPGAPVPPDGLYLMRVFYPPEEVSFAEISI